MIFPGGDIGSLAVNGTVNDLAMAGARPLYLSLGFILEEGLPMETLWQVVQSIQQAAVRAGVQIVTGDTKVTDILTSSSSFPANLNGRPLPPIDYADSHSDRHRSRL